MPLFKARGAFPRPAERGGANFLFSVSTQSFFGAKYFCFSGKVSKFGMEKVGESDTKATRTLLYVKKFPSWQPYIQYLVNLWKHF